VLAGSTAALAYGVAVEPGDLDIVPEIGEENLTRLVRLLEEIEARPQGPFGSGVEGERGERRWVPRPTTEAELKAWRSDPGDPASFDHLLTTRHGNLDVVPALMGSFEALNARAVTVTLAGCVIRVAHIDEVLAGMTVPRRDKDVPRVAALREVQRRGGSNTPSPSASPPDAAADSSRRRRSRRTGRKGP
jgi:hypothetical protein